MTKPSLLFFVILITLFPFILPAQAEEKGIEIKLIEIKGNQKIDQKTIFANLTVSEGQFFSPDQVQSDIKNLYKMGFFDHVDVESEGLEGGIALSFIVQEKPFLVDVLYEGNEEVGKDKLEDALNIKTNTFFDAKRLKRYVKEIMTVYEGDAYYNTSVTPVIQRLPGNQAVLTFLIEEGDQVYIQTIEIEGNTVFDEKTLRKQMETDTYFWLSSWITESGRYQKEQLSFDRERIKDLYFNNGYVNIEIAEPTVLLSEDKKWFDLSFSVTEGDQFRVGEIDYQGQTIFETSDLSAITGSLTGEIFDRSRLRKDIGTITEQYGEKGYIYTNVVPDLRPNPGNLTVDLSFHIIEGEPVKVREINISGNNKTRDKVIRREIRINEQELVNTKALRRSFQRLNNLNFFEDINLTPRRLSPNWVDLEVEVKEKPTGQFSVGGGYSSQDRFIATVDVTLGNFLGKGQLLKFKVQSGGRRDTYTLTFREPYLFDKNLSGTFNAFNQRRSFGVYDEKRTGADAILGTSFGEYVKGSVSYTIETLEVTNLNLETVLIDPATGQVTTDTTIGVPRVQIRRSVPRQVIEQSALGDTVTSAVGFSLSKDTRDFFFDPKEGSRNSISFEFAGTFLGGDNAYYKIIEDSSRFFPLWFNHVFSLHGRVGVAKGIDGKTLPVGERFYVGGINTVRGFNFGEAGPRATLSTPSIFPGGVIGGNKQAYFNAEYLIPLVEDAKVKFLLFYDYGAAFDDGQDIKLSEMRDSAGFGIRWISPVGPLRIEWGYNLHPRQGEPSFRNEFSIGSIF